MPNLHGRCTLQSRLDGERLYVSIRYPGRLLLSVVGRRPGRVIRSTAYYIVPLRISYSISERSSCVGTDRRDGVAIEWERRATARITHTIPSTGIRFRLHRVPSRRPRRFVRRHPRIACAIDFVASVLNAPSLADPADRFSQYAAARVISAGGHFAVAFVHGTRPDARISALVVGPPNVLIGTVAAHRTPLSVANTVRVYGCLPCIVVYSCSIVSRTHHHDG